MPNLVTSREGTVARMYSQLGTQWPNPWWPSGVPAYDDCAAAVSWALFGLNNGQPFQTLVSGIIERSGLQFVAGNQGISRGDCIGFWWSTDVNYDHIELALSAPDGNGDFFTIGTNAGPGDNMAVRTRNISTVHNYARPAYPGFASDGTTPLQNIQGDDDMARLIYDQEFGELALWGGATGFTSLGKRDAYPAGQETLLGKVSGPAIELTGTEFAVAKREGLRIAAGVSSAPGGVDVGALVAAVVAGVKPGVTAEQVAAVVLATLKAKL